MKRLTLRPPSKLTERLANLHPSPFSSSLCRPLRSEISFFAAPIPTRLSYSSSSRCVHGIHESPAAQASRISDRIWGTRSPAASGNRPTPLDPDPDANEARPGGCDGSEATKAQVRSSTLLLLSLSVAGCPVWWAGLGKDEVGMKAGAATLSCCCCEAASCCCSLCALWVAALEAERILELLLLLFCFASVAEELVTAGVGLQTTSSDAPFSVKRKEAGHCLPPGGQTAGRSQIFQSCREGHEQLW